MRARLTWGLFGLCLILTVVGLIVLTPAMAPVKPCSAADFWSIACPVDVRQSRESTDWEGVYPPRDGYFICYKQGFHGEFLYRVRESAAVAELPRVVAELGERLKEEGATTPVLLGYEAWLAADRDRSDAHLLVGKVREAEHLSYRQNRLSRYREAMAREGAFDDRWACVRRYWLNVVFEFVYLAGLVVFAFWPWLRRQALWRKCSHIALLPPLLMLPCYLGYATLTFTSAGPSGGVLYPWLIARLRAGSSLGSWLFLAFPKPLRHVSQPLGPVVSLSTRGVPGLVAYFLAGAAGGLAVFTLLSVVAHLWRARHAGARGGAGAATGEGREGAAPTFWACYRRGVLRISGVVAGAFIVAFGVCVLGVLTSSPFIWVGARGPEGCSALHYAVQCAWGEEAAAHLLAKGADPNARTADGEAPLHLAVGPDLIEMLLRAGADVHAADNYGETPLHNARTAQAAALLLEHGARVDAASLDGRTPLHHAAGGDAPAVVEVLLANGADLEARDAWGQTPLHLAAAEGRDETARTLLGQGADPNAARTDGRTALQIAAGVGDTDMGQALVEGGADVNAVTTDGLTPLDLLGDTLSDQGIRDVLLEHGAKGGP